MNTLLKTIEELEKSGIVQRGVPASEEDIGKAESALNIELTDIYRLFVRTVGILKVYDRSVFGLGPCTESAHDSMYSVIFQTTYSRRASGVPDDFLVLWHNSIGEYQGFASRTNRVDRCPIMVVDYGFDRGSVRPLTEVASSFEEWLHMLVAKQLKVKAMCEREFPGRYSAMGELLPRQPRRRESR